MLNFLGEGVERKRSFIRNSLKMSNDELDEILKFLQCIGAVRKENRRLLITDYGKEVLSKIEPTLEIVDKQTTTLEHKTKNGE
jgi:predicted transcriptional regulator